MFKTIILTGLCCCCLLVANDLPAQSYQSAIGARLGVPFSVSYKTFVSGSNALEVFGGLRGSSFYRWINVGGLYQIHKAIPDVEGLAWYFGGGASAFFYTYDNDFIGDDDTTVAFGLLGNLGLDYKFADAPVNLSLDWVPIFFINGYTSGFGGGYGALSVRYVLK